jgi:hypothetical protein
VCQGQESNQDCDDGQKEEQETAVAAENRGHGLSE